MISGSTDPNNMYVFNDGNNVGVGAVPDGHLSIATSGNGNMEYDFYNGGDSN